MDKNPPPLVSICIAHWQMRELITICLRAIRKYTPNVPIEVIVVDNHSQDDSLEYLRGLSWIRLVERSADEVGSNFLESVPTAYDLGFEQSRGEYFAVMHLDTIVHNPVWLERLLEHIRTDEKIAVVGAWKLDPYRPLYELLKKMTDTKKARLWIRRNLFGDASARKRPREICPRDYCALYRAEPIRAHGLKFGAAGKFAGFPGGERIYYQLKEHGYRSLLLDIREMHQYMRHLSHATAGSHPSERGMRHRRSQNKAERHLRRFFASEFVRELTTDESLDL